ncbi:MAG: hypothetical protein R3B94_04755 [Hyphomonas sp.]
MTPKPRLLDARKIVYLAIFLAIILHGGLLPFTVGQTYDAYIHMFFGDHYHKSWFDPWEPRWYTGFTVTAYPPGGHQLIGLLLNALPHSVAFILVQLISVCGLIVGIYRFSNLWVDDLSASLAALVYVFSTALFQTLHIFGQLPTTLSIGLFLNATPHIFNWIRNGQKRELPFALVFTAGATAAHHVTPIFGTIFFVAPLGILAWYKSIVAADNKTLRNVRIQTAIILRAPIRGILIGALMLAVIICVVYPYWYWSITDPINQVDIPHGSRENFISRLDLGLMFFVIPWGGLMIAVPFAIYKGLRTTQWPLALSVMLCLLLGTGGTTPIPKLLLGPAFGILTLDRFTFWGTVLIAPFAGELSKSLLFGPARKVLMMSFGRVFSRIIIVMLATAYAFSGVFVAVLPLFKPTQPDFIDPQPIVQFMAEDGHSNWRYLTLGFGDQFAYHSALIDGYSIDGNYHSARRLPMFTSYSVERLENSKYLGVPGLGSLQQFVANTEDYNLKFIFSNDEFYDPLLYYSGWKRLLRLQNGVVVWEKPGVPPLEFPLPRRQISKFQSLLWGTLPISSLLLAFVSLGLLGITGRLLSSAGENRRPSKAEYTPHNKSVIITRYTAIVSAIVLTIATILWVWGPTKYRQPHHVISDHYIALDFRDFKTAYEQLHHDSRPSFDQYLKTLRSKGGLIYSYSKLLDIKSETLTQTDGFIEVNVARTYLTALGLRVVERTETLLLTEAGWKLKADLDPKLLSDAIVSRDISLGLQDLSQSRLELRGSQNNGPDRPSLRVGRPTILQADRRIRVVGSLSNTSSFPACADVSAKASFTNSQPARQSMGLVGAHRLSPGETRFYSIEFEGVLRIQDAHLGMGYDPEFFRLPEFNSTPLKVELTTNSSVCGIDRVGGIAIQDIVYDERKGELNFVVRHNGTITAGVVNLMLTYFDNDGHAILVEPFYLETNLIPGESKQVAIKVPNESEIEIVGHAINLNARASQRDQGTKHQPKRIKLPHSSAFSAVYIDVDAMPFEPSF